MAYRRIVRLFCLFGYTHSSIWLSPGGILFVFLFPLFVMGSWLVVLLQVLEGKWLLSVSLGVVRPVQYLSLRLEPFWVGFSISPILSQKVSRPSTVRPFESDCSMLYWYYERDAGTKKISFLLDCGLLLCCNVLRKKRASDNHSI